MDTINIYYDGSFLAYEADRLVSWLIIFLVVSAAWFLLRQKHLLK
jgi:hypothetical protein